jgi:hypothetical protein
VDRGVLQLDGPYTYDPKGGCFGAAPGTETNRQWLDAMITASENRSACALIKQLHQLGQIDAMTNELRDLRIASRRVAVEPRDATLSRKRWTEINIYGGTDPQPLAIDVWDRAESLTFLRMRGLGVCSAASTRRGRVRRGSP